VPVQDQRAESWPKFMRVLPPKERALTFALSCGAKRAPCGDLSSCIRQAVVTQTGLYDVQRIRVTNETVKNFPSVRDLVGKEVIIVVFVLQRCNIGCYVIVESDRHD